MDLVLNAKQVLTRLMDYAIGYQVKGHAIKIVTVLMELIFREDAITLSFRDAIFMGLLQVTVKLANKD